MVATGLAVTHLTWLLGWLCYPESHWRWMTEESDEYKALRREWYARLAEDGFEDIEILDAGGNLSLNMLRGVSQGDLRRRLYKPESEEFFRCARKHVWSISDPIRRHVWRLYAEGLPKERIHRTVGGRYDISFKKVEKIIREETARMKARANRELDAEFTDE